MNQINIDLWLTNDTSYITKDTSNNVSVWIDKSGKNRNATQSNDINKPIFNNIDKSINFDGLNSYFNVDLDWLSGKSHMAFIVINTNKVNLDNNNKPDSSFLYGAGTGFFDNQSFYGGFRNKNTLTLSYFFNDFNIGLPSTFQDNKNIILTFEWVVGSYRKIYLNSSLVAIYNNNPAAISIPKNGGRIGGNIVTTQVWNDKNNFKGKIKEIIFLTDSNINTSNIETINNYLLEKYILEHPPTITNLDISLVSTLGGQTITINGTNFDSNYNPVVKINGSVVTSTIISSTEITFIVPANNVGSKLVTVTNDFGTSNSFVLTYVIFPLTITNLNNSLVSTLGGQTITINGYSFDNNPIVKIDGLLVNSTILSPTQITFVTPANNTGSKLVTVTNDIGTSNSVTLTYSLIPLSNICFPAETPIFTDQGIISIEKLDSKIHSIRKNKIETITKTITQDKYLVCIEKDALSKNIPSEKTLISKNHKLFYNGLMIQANDLLKLGYEGIYKVKYSGEILYNVLLDNNKHNKMIVNNLICETLDPKNGIAQLYYDLKKEKFTYEEEIKIIERYNELAIMNKTFSK